MATFSQVVTVSSTSYPTDPQVTIPFRPRTISACIIGVTSVDAVAVGIGSALSDSGRLVPLTAASAYTWDGQRAPLVWLRLIAGTTQDVEIVAED